jgi:hypothetical protein
VPLGLHDGLARSAARAARLATSREAVNARTTSQSIKTREHVRMRASACACVR